MTYEPTDEHIATMQAAMQSLGGGGFLLPSEARVLLTAVGGLIERDALRQAADNLRTWGFPEAADRVAARAGALTGDTQPADETRCTCKWAMGAVGGFRNVGVGGGSRPDPACPVHGAPVGTETQT